MRFYVPNMEEKEEPEGEGDDKMENQGEKEKKEEGESEDETTPAKVFNDLIIKHANIGDTAGDIIASFHDLPLQVPRGKYTLDMFSNYARFHGRTHDYKIMYKDIVKVFQLPRIDRDQIVFLI